MTDREALLRAQASALWAAQEQIMRLACECMRAADRAERDALEEAEARELLRQAKKWLGPTAKEAA